jgi:predicted DNA-binding transcriptional regulator AlpA
VTKRRVGTDLTRREMLRAPQVIEMVGLSIATIRRLMRLGLFPDAIKVGLHAIAWRLSDIENYLAQRPKANLAPPKPQDAADLGRRQG